MSTILQNIFTAEFAYSVIRVATPLLLAAMAALISTRAGVLNITIEGTMLMAAFGAAAMSYFTNSLLISFLFGVALGVLMQWLYAFLVFKVGSPSTLTGVAMNLASTGLTIFLCFLVGGDKSSTSTIRTLVFPKLQIPLIKEIPVIGTILSGQNLLTYLAFLSVLLVYWVVFKTPFGLHLRTVGENEEAAKSVGMDPVKVKTLSLMLSGVFSAMGGMYLSMGYVQLFTSNMTNGRGFIGIAANAVGRSIPSFSLLATLLFAFVEALSNYMQMLRLPTEIIYSLPYVATIILMLTDSSAKDRKAKGRKKKAVSALLHTNEAGGPAKVQGRQDDK